MNNIMNNLGLQKDEYNRYIAQMKGQIVQQPTQTEQYPHSHSTIQPRIVVPKSSGLTEYIFTTQRQLIRRIELYSQDENAIKILQSYLDYLPTLETADTNTVNEAKGNIIRLLEMYPCDSNLEATNTANITLNQPSAVAFQV